MAKKSKVTLESLQLMLRMHQDGRLVMPDMMIKQIEKEIKRRLALETSK